MSGINHKDFLTNLKNGDYSNHIILLRHCYEVRTAFFHNNKEFDHSFDQYGEGSVLYRPSSIDKMLELTKAESQDEIQFIICDTSAHSGAYFNEQENTFDIFADKHFTDYTSIVFADGLRDTEQYID